MSSTFSIMSAPYAPIPERVVQRSPGRPWETEMAMKLKLRELTHTGGRGSTSTRNAVQSQSNASNGWAFCLGAAALARRVHHSSDSYDSVRGDRPSLAKINSPPCIDSTSCLNQSLDNTSIVVDAAQRPVHRAVIPRCFVQCDAARSRR